MGSEEKRIGNETVGGGKGVMELWRMKRCTGKMVKKEQRERRQRKKDQRSRGNNEEKQTDVGRFLESGIYYLDSSVLERWQRGRRGGPRWRQEKGGHKCFGNVHQHEVMRRE